MAARMKELDYHKITESSEELDLETACLLNPLTNRTGATPSFTVASTVARLPETQLWERYRFDRIIGRSPAMGRVFQMIERVAPTDATVLINGRTGTGKELVARALHRNSPRA